MRILKMLSPVQSQALYLIQCQYVTSLATLDYVRDEIERLWGLLSSHGGRSSAAYAQPLQYRNSWWNIDFVLGWEGGATFPSLPGWQVRWW